MNIIRTKKDNIIESINFGGNKTQTVQHVLQMQNVSFCPEYIKKYKPCSTMLPKQLHKSHPVQAMQYHVTKTAS